MNQGVEGRHEEVLSRHPLAALSFGALLTFVGGRARRGSIAAGRSATPSLSKHPRSRTVEGSSDCSPPRAWAGGQHDPSELTVR
jgi:hypothetical protein